jgi:hypothetical protein
MAASDGVTLEGSSSGDLVGYSVSLGGDVDADGYDDVLVGGTGATTGGGAHDGGADLLLGPATTSGAIGR